MVIEVTDTLNKGDLSVIVAKKLLTMKMEDIPVLVMMDIRLIPLHVLLSLSILYPSLQVQKYPPSSLLQLWV